MTSTKVFDLFGRPRLKHVAILLGFATGAFMALRFAEQYILARRFGPSATLDAYFVAQVLILFASQCAVAVTSAGIPIITSQVRPGDECVQPADFTITACLVVISTVLAAVLFFSAPIVVKLLGPGLDQSASVLARTLFRYSIPAAFFLVIAAGLRAHWHSRQNLLRPGLLQLLTPAVSTSLAIAVAARLLGIEWVSLGAGVGALLFALALARPFLQVGKRYQSLWNFAIAKEFGAALFPVCLAMMLIPCLIAVGRLFASRLDSGNVSGLSVAASLMSIPGQLAATSVGIAILPRTSSFLADNKLIAAASLIERALRITVFSAAPFAFLFGLYPVRILAMLFRGGSFDSHAINLTATALMGYCFGIPALGAMQVLVFALFACSAWRQVAGVTILSFAVNVALSALFGHSIRGIASAFSVTCCVSSVLLILLLKRFITFSPARLLLSLTKAIFAAVVAFGVVQLACLYLGLHLPSLFQISLSFAGYIVVAALFCKPELREVMGLLDFRKPSQATTVQEETTLAGGAQ